MTRKLITGALAGTTLLLAAGSSTLWAQRANDPVEICHKPGTPAEHTIVVDDNAVRGHLGHGDFLGSCSGGGGSGSGS
jgi:hypothetical protein